MHIPRLYEQTQARKRIHALRVQLEREQQERNATDAASRWAIDAKVTRAVFVQLGQDRWVHFLVQLKWFLLSWVYMRKLEPSRLKTDVLVFTQIEEEEFPGALRALKELGCTTDPRTSFAEPSTCRIRDYTPMKFRNPNTDPVARRLPFLSRFMKSS